MSELGPLFPGVPASQCSIYINYRNFIYIFFSEAQLDKYLPIYNIKNTEI